MRSATRSGLGSNGTADKHSVLSALRSAIDGIERNRPSAYVRRMRPLASAITGLVLLLVLGGAAASSTSPRHAAAAIASCPNGKPAMGITQIRAIQLDLLRRSSFNNLNGAQVARDLLSHRKLWCAALID